MSMSKLRQQQTRGQDCSEVSSKEVGYSSGICMLLQQDSCSQLSRQHCRNNTACVTLSAFRNGLAGKGRPARSESTAVRVDLYKF